MSKLACSQAGVQHIILTMGQHGAAHCQLSKDHQAVVVSHMPALPAQVANTSGAGDCLVAGALMRLLEGGDPTSALAHGLVGPVIAKKPLSVVY